LATAFFSTVTATLAAIPSEGDCTHVNEVSLCHLVTAHALTPKLERGPEFLFEKYLPRKCVLVVPVVLYEEKLVALLT
jgi:hypothetical protein